MKVWSGSAWAEKPVKVWSGSAWVTKPTKVWNGSAWVVKPAVGGGAIALVGAVQRGTQSYPGSNNYNFTVDVGSGAGRKIGVLAVASHQGTTGISACTLDPAGANVALTVADTMGGGLGGGGAAAFYGNVPDAVTGSKTIRIVVNEDWANMCAFQMHILTGATFHGGDANSDASSPNNANVAIASIPAGSFIGALGITLDTTSYDNNGPFPVGDTPVYAEATDQGFQYGSSYVLNSVGGSISGLTLRNGTTASNVANAIAAIAWKP